MIFFGLNLSAFDDLDSKNKTYAKKLNPHRVILSGINTINHKKSKIIIYVLFIIKFCKYFCAMIANVFEKRFRFSKRKKLVRPFDKLF